MDRVAVIIPTMLDRDPMTMEAIQSALCQTVRPHEIFVICEPGELNVLIERVNKAIAGMESERFVWLCDDDILCPDFIEQTIQFDADIVYTAMEYFGRDFGVIPARTWGPDIVNDTVPFISSLVKKTMWEQVGGFDKVRFLDWDFWWKCYEAGADAHRLDLPLWKHRQHADQSSWRINWEEARMEVLRKHGFA